MVQLSMDLEALFQMSKNLLQWKVNLFENPQKYHFLAFMIFLILLFIWLFYKITTTNDERKTVYLDSEEEIYDNS